MKKTLLVNLAVACLAATCFAEQVVYTTSNGTSVSGGVSGSAGYVDDCTGGGVCSYYLGSTSSVDVGFTITLNLDNSMNSLSSALLTYGGELSPTEYGNYDYSYGSQGEWISGSYGCGFLNEDTCYDYSSAYYTASVSSSGYVGPVTLTGISSSSNTWSGSIDSGSVDLLSLGFGPDLVSGGQLTLTGYEWVAADLTSITYGGFNSYNNFEAYYDVNGSMSATLELDESTPEPQTGWLLSGGLMLLFLARFARAGRRRSN